MRAPRALALLLSPCATFAAGPSEFHLAVAGPGAVSVSFRLPPSSPGTPEACTFAPAAGGAPRTAPTVVRSYAVNGTGFFHHAELGALAPATAFTYACAGGPTFSFLSPPAAGALPVAFATFGDWGYLGSKERGPSLPVGGLSLNWSAVPVRQLLEALKDAHAVDLVVHTGDINYADDGFGEHPLEFTYENVTDGWFAWIQCGSFVLAEPRAASEALTPTLPPPLRPETSRPRSRTWCRLAVRLPQ